MPAKILVVEDEPQFERLVRQRFRRKIREGAYEFVFAADGLEALEVLEQQDDIQLVLSDINMPRMDGLTLVARLQEKYPDVKAVMVSAYGDMKNIRTAMNLGAFDFVTKPIEFDDLEATIEKALREAEVARQAARTRELEAINEQLSELDALKSRFFTNISHEFRTPLTVISGMIGQVEENPGRWLRKGAEMIRRNTDNLLNLVNQILDLRKLEAGKLELQLRQGNVVSYLHYICDSFQGLALERDIQLHFEPAEPEIIMDFDPEKLLRILSNLLSNALKFTPPGGEVFLETKQQAAAEGEPQLQLTVRDTGIGIAEEGLPHLFERFYQVEAAPSQPPSLSERHSPPSGGQGGAGAGTGIGLALAKELAELMDGKLAVESQLGEGTSFFLNIPIRRNAETKGTEPPAPAAAQLGPPEESLILRAESSPREFPTLLLVEDNADVRQYLFACLEGHYRLEVARDGQEGIDKAIEQVPDLILSDVMMPRRDGFELCHTLKEDPRTSHIPIVLLTAQADDESRIAGLKRGADDYLAKPFRQEELLARLENLLETRRRLQERFRNLETQPTHEGEAEPMEDAFIRSVREAVEANIDDVNFGIQRLCRAVALSRSQLHNKIKALTGLSTALFIRSIRLHRARQLLAQPHMNVSQVAYEVGFKDPRYFTRTYAEEFGENPSETMKKIQ